MNQPHASFSQALCSADAAKGVTQDQIDSWAYVSTLPRRLERPSLVKFDVLTSTVSALPLTWLPRSCCGKRPDGGPSPSLARVGRQAKALRTSS
jgi:hypothetical protein